MKSFIEILLLVISLNLLFTGEVRSMDWTFSEGPEGWGLINSLSGHVLNGVYYLDITGNDPVMQSPDNLGINAGTYKYVKVRMKNNTSDNEGRIIFIREDDSGFPVTGSQSFWIHPNDYGYREYVIDMSYNSEWTGTITQIRLEPAANISSGSINLDHVKLSDHLDQVIVPSDPSVSTDTLHSGELTVGINSNGGGVINYLEMPGVGNIFGPQSFKYGRSGQSAMRDGMHSGRYNPTQAGFNETLGTPCDVEEFESKLVVPSRPLALWYGDCKWDFTEWENIGPDPRCYDDGDNSDVDELDESDLVGKQNTEVKSEFDYFGFYHDYKGKGGIEIASVRHYFEYRYIRPPGHCIKQFRPGLDIFNDNQIQPDISSTYPPGPHMAEEFDMSNFILSWHLRNDVENWDPKFQYIKNQDGSWTIQERDVYVKEVLGDNGEVLQPRLLILSDSNDPDTGGALGFYMPESEFNAFETIGVNEMTGKIEYRDNRYESIRLWDQPRRIPSMAVYGFKVETKGLLNRTRLPEDVYEAYRFDMFMFMGTPNEIEETVNKIEGRKTVWNFDNSMEDWAVSSDINASTNDSALHLEFSGTNSEILSPGDLLIDTELHKFVTIRLKNNTSESSVEFLFDRYNTEESFSHTIDVSSNDETWQTYTIDVASLENWEGMIQQIGYKFPTNSGGLEIDFIGVTSDGFIDCNNDFQGSAFIDACGDCVGGNTGKEPCEDCMGVIDGDAYLNDCGDCVGGTSPLEEELHEWHFDNLEDWTLNPRLNGTSNNGIADLTITGNDPFMNYDGPVCLDTEQYEYVRFKFKNLTNGNAATLYYKNDMTNAWNHKSVQVSQNDTKIQTYTIDMADEENWKGNIREIRFDPPGSDGEMALDYIGILTEENVNSSINEETLGEKFLKIYPNPANNFVTIKTLTVSAIEVYNLKGVKVYETSKKNNNHNIYTESWEPGLYFLKIISDSEVIKKKLFISH